MPIRRMVLMWPLLTGVLLTFYFLAAIPEAVFWRDEAHAAAIADLPWPQFLQTLVSDWHPFSHLVGLKLWMGLVGGHEHAIRVFALVNILISLAVFTEGFRRWWGRLDVAVFAATLMHASSVVMFHLTSTVKPYAFALMGNGFLVMALASLGQRWSGWRLAGVGTAALVALNAQPVNFPFGAALFLAWCIGEFARCPGTSWWTALRRSLATGTCLAIAGLPTLIQALRYQSVETGDTRVPLEQFTLLNLIRFVVDGFQQLGEPIWRAFGYLLYEIPPEALLPTLQSAPWPLALLAMLVLGYLAVVAARSMIREGGRLLTLQSAVVFAVVLSLLWLSGFANDRMIMPIKSYSALAPAVAILLALIVRPAPKLMLVLMAAMIIRMSLAFPAYAEQHPGRRSDGKDAAAFVGPRLDPKSDAMLLLNTAIAPTFHLYLDVNLPRRDHPYDHKVRYWNMITLWSRQGDPAEVDRTLSFIRDHLQAGRRLWLIGGGTPPPMEPAQWYSARELPVFLAEAGNHGNLVLEQEFRTTPEPFTVALYEPRPSETDEQALDPASPSPPSSPPDEETPAP